MNTKRPDADTMNIGHRGADGTLSKTPPKHPLPLTPPRTVQRSLAINSVQQLRRYRADRKADEAEEIVRIQINKEFDPHQHLEKIGDIFRRFDCYPTAICVRMPSPIHELVISDLEREYTIKQDRRGGRCSDIKLGRSSRVYLDGKKESRQPDIQFRHKSEKQPRVIIEVALSQTEKELEILAYDYILKSDGKIKTVYGIDLNPPGKSSTVSRWCARVTPSDDPAYEEEVRVEKILYKAFRAADGSPANPDECVLIPFGNFDIDLEEQNSGISIPFRSIFDAYREAQEMEAQSETDVESQRPAKRTKRIWRTPSPIEQLNPEDETRFQAAEKAAEDLNEGSDFELSDDGHESDRSSQRS
ncbi:hypothetical protein NOR_08528 [Metarhizium rileyi]|uniref:Uncharacterized protein n=1 Tax=Metarhizium rileyi (strain RCEF 4871) TaxID=1649241 RepID=A0A166W3F1_METRR|nr:hypothetical protein NOR_08528 [Metarhizium rileyi RCEF 4871]TWU70887.1 hypothetical protein ED733_001098 [Metarhizium rileyi]